MKRIVTVHDLSFLTHPECAAPGIAQMYSKIVPRSVARADHVIADSQHTASDLVELLGVAREKISVIYLGVDSSFAPVRVPDRLAALDDRLGLPHPLVLAVGTIEPRKNFPALIAAFARARAQPGGPRMLAISGRKGWLYDETFAAVKKYAVEDAVRFLDFIPDDDLATLYSAADVLVMPSIDEGFGLPVIEAMACGTPVVVSDAGALPEVVGDAGIAVSLRQEGALADALARVTSNPQLREELSARGLERVRGFTWEQAARSALALYGELAGGDGKRAYMPATMPRRLANAAFQWPAFARNAASK
jgi:glycosyltransferase involved in cell wall biosynthesis